MLKGKWKSLCQISSDPFMTLGAMGPSAFTCGLRNASFISTFHFENNQNPPPSTPTITLHKFYFQSPDSSGSRPFPFASILIPS